MAKTLTQELPFDDISKTAAALLLFWREYRTEIVLPKGTRLKFERWRDEQSLIEYNLSGYVSAYTGQPDGSIEMGHFLFRMELVSMPFERQEIRFHNVSKPDNSVTLSPLLSDDEIDNIFHSFLNYLREKGYLSHDPNDETASADSLHRDDLPPLNFKVPTRPKIRQRWIDAYEILKNTPSIFLELFNNSATDDPKPSTEDYVSALIAEKIKAYERRTIDRILEAGDKGHLT